MIKFLWDKVAELRLIWQLLIKITIFSIVLFFVLFPNPVIFVEQVKNLSDLESLIQSDFSGIEEINSQIDTLLAENCTLEEEFQIIQHYIYKNIPYSYDWDNWGVVDYWPSADAVWQRRTEDCDGRAVLAAAILRSRGFETANLAGSLRHVWVTVDGQELMGPDKEKSLKKVDGKTIISLPSWKMILTGFAFILSEFPAIRNLIILLTALILLYHPCKNMAALFAATTAALLGFILLMEWGEKFRYEDYAAINFEFIFGFGLLSTSIILILLCRLFYGRIRSSLQHNVP